MTKGLLVVLGVALILAASAAAYRTWRQHDAAKALAIRSPNGIDEAGFVTINGVEQWISIRGEDRSNPVLVLLHGGPGVAFLPVGYKALRSWEKDFTVVQWDQPGAGRTFGEHGPENSGELTLDRIAADGIAVVEHARKQLGKDKVVLVGVSWGSVVGVEMARRRPDLIHTYVGAGQVVDMQRNEAVGFDALLQKVRAKGDTKAEAKLLAIGAPPYAGREELLAERKVLEANPPQSERGLYRSLIPVLLSAPDYGLKDIRAWFDAGKFSIGKMLPALMTYSDDVPAPAIPVPVVFLQGVEDIQTPTVLVKSYFERLQAPSKRLVLIPGGGHSAVLAMPDVFLKALNTHVRPTVIEAETR